MPNHITTSIEIKGPKDKLAKLIKDTELKLDVNAEENKFDFNAIIPMPEELQITSGSSTDLGMAALSELKFNIYSSYPWFSGSYPNVKTKEDLEKFLENGSDSDKRALIEGKQAISNLKKYGFKDWYDWSVAKWGTKWNSYNVQYISHDDNHLVLSIDTAWDTPRQIWRALKEQGFEVNGIVSGEMEGTDTIGDGGPFWAETNVQFDEFSPYEGEK